jgi:hypothetical protein
VRLRTLRASSDWLPAVQAILGDVPVMRGYRRLWVGITVCPRPFCDCQHCRCRCERRGKGSCRCHAADCYCDEAEPLRLLEARPLGWAVRDSPARRGVRQLVLIDMPGTSPAVRERKCLVYARLWWHLDASDDWELGLILIDPTTGDARVVDLRQAAADLLPESLPSAPWISFTQMLASARRQLGDPRRASARGNN